MTTSIGAGIGGAVVIAQQPSYGASFVSPTRAPTFKSFKATYNPHPVQGGPYLRDGQPVDQGSARVLSWLDAKATLAGDVMTSGHALLFASALGTAATLTQLASTTAYELGGSSATTLSVPDKNNTFLDLQAQVPDASGTVHPENYHSGLITKAEWVFDRVGLVSYSYDLDFQYLEKTTGLVAVTEPGGPVPFTMINNGGSAGQTSQFRAGAFGSEATIDGVRKATVTLERKVQDDRIYLSNQYKDMPVTNDLVDITVALAVDYTTAAKTGLFDLFLAGTPTSLVCSAVSSQIGVSGDYNTFQVNPTNCFVQTGGESSLDGPKIVNNTITFKGTMDASGNDFVGTLITADTGW